MKRLFIILVLFFFIPLYAQQEQTIEIGAFNIEWFPCKDDGEMMKKYGIDFRYYPEGNSTNIKELFSFLKEPSLSIPKAAISAITTSCVSPTAMLNGPDAKPISRSPGLLSIPSIHPSPVSGSPDTV